MRQPMTGIAPQMAQPTTATPKYNPGARDVALRQLAAAPVPATAPAPAATPEMPAAGQPSPYEQEWDRLQGQAPVPSAPQANAQGMAQANSSRMRRMRANQLAA
jgi:hypothetical protein